MSLMLRQIERLVVMSYVIGRSNAIGGSRNAITRLTSGVVDSHVKLQIWRETPRESLTVGSARLLRARIHLVLAEAPSSFTRLCPPSRRYYASYMTITRGNDYD